MGASHFSGPVSIGTKIAGESGGPNQGLVTLQQTVAFQADGTTAVAKTVRVPKSAVLIGFYVDTLTAWTAATAGLTIGKILNPPGLEFAPVIDVKVAGRANPTLTAANLAAMRNVTVLGVPVADNLQNLDIYLVVTSTTPTTVGYTQATLLYTQV